MSAQVMYALRSHNAPMRDTISFIDGSAQSLIAQWRTPAVAPRSSPPADGTAALPPAATQQLRGKARLPRRGPVLCEL